MPKGDILEIELHSHRHALELLGTLDEYKILWAEVLEAIESLTDERVISHFQTNFENKGLAVKSISRSINTLLDQALSERGWSSQSKIFSNSAYGAHKWRLDFAKRFPETSKSEKNAAGDASGISIEVAFNNGGSISWNLIKPVLASEQNHLPKAFQTSLGIVIAATKDLKKMGGFDNAVGTYQNYVSNLVPLRDILTVPILVVGLSGFDTFKVVQDKKGGKTYGRIERL